MSESMGAANESSRSQAVSSGTNSAGRVHAAVARFSTRLERNAFIVLALGACVSAQARHLRAAMGPDSWLAILSGRLIAATGLPHHDTLTAFTLGRAWVDEEWLGDLGFYGLWRIGGWPLALLAVVVFYGLAFAILAATARRLGASDRSVALVTLACFATGFPNTEMRPQIAACVLFAGVVALLLRDERNPSFRVFLVFPLLVVWANVHGSVVLGSALVALRGLTLAGSALRARARVSTWLSRAAAFVLLPWLCTLASPYGLALPGYYWRVLHNPTLADVVTEWAPATLRNQPGFVVALLIAFWLMGRAARALSPFACLALVTTGILGLYALRNGIWFAFVAAATLPAALDIVWKSGSAPRRRRVNLILAQAGIAVAVAAVAVAATRPGAWYRDSYPPAAAAAVARATARDPKLLVFSDERYSDWLLFDDPRLAGKVAYDIRFELLTTKQLASIFTFHLEVGSNWLAPTRGYGLLVLNPVADPDAIRLIERRRGSSVLFRDPDVVVLRR